MGQSYAPRGTTVAPAAEVSGGQQGAAPQRTSAARGNQAMQERLPPEAPDCALGDDEGCGLDVTLDEILGEGAEAGIHDLMDTISGLVGRGLDRLSSLGQPELTERFSHHFDGALNLNGLLNDKGVALQASATWDENGELTWNRTLEMQVLIVEGRAEAAIRVLEAVEQVLDARALEPFLGAIEAFRRAGTAGLAGLAIRTQSGSEQLELLERLYRQHENLYIERRNATLKQIFSMSLGPVEDFFTGESKLKRAWSGANAAIAAFSQAESGWEALKALKSMTSFLVSEAVKNLDPLKPLQARWKTISLVVNTIHLVVEGSAATKEYKILQALEEQGQRVMDEYGADIRFYEEHAESIQASLEAMRSFTEAGGVVQARVAAAESVIAQSGAESQSFYHPFV